MHVLIIPSESVGAPWSPLGGVFQVDLGLALAASGHQVGILSVGKCPTAWTFSKFGIAEVTSEGGVDLCRRYLRMPIPQAFDRGMRLGRLYSRVAASMLASYVQAHGRPDLLHAHNVRYGGSIACALSDSEGIPFVLTEHSSEYSTGRVTPAERPLYRRIMQAAAAVSCVSSAFARQIAGVLEVREDLIDVLPNVLPESFASAPDRRDPFPEDSEFTFLTVGELIPIKNHALLLRAFAQAFQGGSTRLRLVGGGPLAADLLTLAHALGIAQQVDFLGRMPRDRVREEMHSADAFVLSSRSETFGVVLIEALSQGLPVVSTACGGPLDVVGEGDGILVPVDDVNALTDGLRRMRKMAGAFDRTLLIRRCQARYSASSVSRAYENWYEHARKTAGRGAQP